jgi:gliding motility-associated-like protein
LEKKLHILLFIAGLLSITLLKAQPVANFTAVNTSGCSPLTVQFTSTSTGNPTSYFWTFGNGNTSTLQNPSATYVSPGTYTVSLSVTNAAGTNVKTMTGYVNVHQNPVADFSGVPLNGCVPLKVTFSDLSSGPVSITQWQWDFGNGFLSNQQNPLHTFNTIGSFPISLNVTDANGCTGKVNKPGYITASNSITVDFTGSRIAPCKLPDTSFFSSTISPPGAYTYLWKFGDGGTSTLANPSHPYTTKGSYDVELEVTSATGCKSSVLKSKFVEANTLSASFTYVVTSSCAPTVATMLNTSKPNTAALAFNWKLNESQDKYSTNASYLLMDETNDVMLVAKSPGGCMDTVKQTIRLSTRPVAGFKADKYLFCEVPATVNFTDTSKGSPTIWTWTFGNGVTGNTRNPTLSYSNEGTYNVRLIASKGGTCADTAYTTIKIGKPNVSIIDQHKKQGCVPLTTSFGVTDNSIVPLTDWKWEMGSTLLSSSPAFVYTFPDTGIFVVKVTGRNADGCTFIGYDTVKVGQRPVIDFTANKFSGCYNRTEIRFTSSITGAMPDEYEWDFGGKAPAKSRNPVITFQDTGIYYVTLTASHRGCQATVTKPGYITIKPAIARFNYDINECTTDTVRFINLSSGQNKYQWNFGDLYTSTEATPTHSYSVAGTMTVRLIAEDTVTRCTDTMIQVINVIRAPQVRFTPGDTGICPGSRVTFTDKTVIDSSRSIQSWTYNLSDGRRSSAQNPGFEFPNQGLTIITLTVMDNKNCTYQYTDTVKVFSGTAKMKLDRSAGCIPLPVEVSDHSVTENPVASRKWRWGNNDSTTSAASVYTYTYTQRPANQNKGHLITMIVTDTKGCTFTDTIRVKPTRPVAGYTYRVGKACGLDTVYFKPVKNDTSLYSPGSYRWSLPLGVSPLENPNPIYMSGDMILSIKLQVTDGNGCIDSVRQNIRINTTLPSIGFTASPANVPCYKSYTPVTFIDTTVKGGSGIAAKSWNFGDNSTAGNIDTASRVYKNPGKYTVSLTVKDSAGCQVTRNIPAAVVVGGPYGTYTFNPRKGCNPVEVDFSVSSPNAKYYIWDHADGHVDTFRVDTHTYVYNRVGVYYPRITLMDSSETCDLGYDAIDSIVVFPLPEPDFTVSQTLICKNTSATFTGTTAPHPYPVIGWKWKFGTGDSSMLKGPVSQRFPNTGKFDISLEVTDVNGCKGLTVKDTMVTVNDDLDPPAVPLVKRATVLDDSRVLLEFSPNNEPDFARYLIYTDNTIITVNDISDTSFTETGLNTLITPYSYKVSAVDVCFNQSALSEKHTTVELTATPAINAVDLTWTPYEGFDSSKLYEIWRKGPADALFAHLVTVPGDTLHYSDTSVLCNARYTYRIKTVETDTSLQISWSDTSEAEPVYVPLLPVPENIRATVENNRFVRVEWHRTYHNRAFSYRIFRSVDNEAPVFFGTFAAGDTILVDKNVDVHHHSYTYTTYLADACGGISAPSNIARTILLNVRMVGNDILKHDPELTWNPYEKWNDGVHHYNVAFYYDSLQGFELISRNAENELSQRHRYVNLTQSDYCYIVTAFSNKDTSVTSESNIACVTTAPRLYAPNAFTINNDGLNDAFYVRGVFIEKFSLQIFNRWGQKVFETNDMNQGWNGMFEGQPCKPDVFVYLAEGIGKKGQRISISGNVTLLR